MITYRQYLGESSTNDDAYFEQYVKNNEPTSVNEIGEHTEKIWRWKNYFKKIWVSSEGKQPRLEMWCKGGDYRGHRINGPATIDRTKEYDSVLWCQEGQLHRDDGPAVIYGSGENIAYFKHGKLHNEKGPALISGDTRRTEWWKNGEIIKRYYARVDITEHWKDRFAFDFKIEGSIENIYTFYNRSFGFIVLTLDPRMVGSNFHNYMFRSVRDGIQTMLVPKYFTKKTYEALITWIVKNHSDRIHLLEEIPKYLQEKIIKKRPDLIGDIKGLDPELKEKYQHELELSKVDI